MPQKTEVYRFGPFELDATARLLMRGPEPIAVGERSIDVLIVLASRTGQVVAKEALIEAVWQGAAITDNTLERALWSLRKVLGIQPDGAPYIETLVRIGYRFVAPVQRVRLHASALNALLAPYGALVEGRAALDTLGRDAVVRAREALDEALRSEPESAAAHVEMANACVLRFESTRADAAPDVAALRQAVHHAWEGCRLDPSSGEAWSALAFALHPSGDSRKAIAAARKAVTLEPDVSRHYLRLAFVSWGDERVRAARRVLTLYPELALPHWLAATVLIARQAFEPAIEHLRAGCAAQDEQSREHSRFNAVGLHLLHGLVLAARGAVDDALEQFTRELACEGDGQVYARECAANTWYSCGALHLRQGRHDRAERAFREALDRVAGHPFAVRGLTALSRPGPAASEDVNAIDAALAHAAGLALIGRHDEAARLFGEALAGADPGQDGWLLPVEPLLHVTAHADVWTQTLALLRHRAA
jgi:DNA-binding winged helix-turn-helix (wHTH) protein/Tfp pilus assembly protein PilF